MKMKPRIKFKQYGGCVTPVLTYEEGFVTRKNTKYHYIKLGAMVHISMSIKLPKRLMNTKLDWR